MMHHRKAVRALLATTLGLTVVLTGGGSTWAQPGKDLTGTSLSPESIQHIAALKSKGSDKVSVIVQLEDAPLASYTGGVTGLAATSPKVTGMAALDVRSADSQAYLGHLARKQSDFEASARGAVSNPQVTNRLNVVVNAVSMVVQADQVEKLARIAGVKAVMPDELLQIDTDRSPAFIGATDFWEEVGGQQNAGEGVIVGVLDTGIWPEHPSLADAGAFGGPYPAPPPPRSGTRQCEFSGGANPGPAFSCNNKLIGADRFMATYDAIVGLIPGEFTSARDDNGHGTHTSTTAAGNGRVHASIFGVDRGQVSGIAPRAHVIMYKVCGDSGCFSSDSAAAVQKAIQDGVNVINYSISGGRNPFSDTVERAFLDAYNAGVFVAASAGNSGPTPDSTDHRGPWVTTVAASTHTRAFTSTATLRASNGDTLRLTGTSLTLGIPIAKPVVLPDQPNEAMRLCGNVPGTNPFVGTPFTGKIVVCERGITGRVEKGFNVKQAGAVGMLLRNPVVQDQETDNHFLPTVHLNGPEGTQLLNFLNTHTGVTATFPTGAVSRAQGDVMAAFSSRGGPGQTLGISKPDVTAPGVQILAGNSPQHVDVAGGPNGELFQAIAGTSMSSPHVAGAAALIKNLHPTWSPGEIKSALMTTAKLRVVKEDGTTPTTPFDDGSGRIDLSSESSADNPGITFSETGAGFLAKQNDLWNANYPSIYVPKMPGIVTLDRTAHSQLTRNSRWSLRVFEKPEQRDLQITVPDNIDVPAGGDLTFEIVIDARNVPIGQVRSSQIELKSGERVLHMPVTIVRQQAAAELTKTCAPATFARGATSVCQISATNTSFDPAAVSITDTLPNKLELVTGSVTGASQSGNSLSFTGILGGVQPPNVTIASAPGSSPAGYLPLAAFGIPPIAGLGDESIANFTVPAFTFAGKSYTSVGVVSNGYVVVGGGTAGDIQFVNQNMPDPARPNNTLAPFWTDLDLSKSGAARIGTLTDGADTWIVIDFAGVPEFGSTTTDSFEIWIGVDGDAHPGEDITFTYGTVGGNGTEGMLTVGAENVFGNRGQNFYFNGAGTLPTSNTTELRVTGTAGGPGETHKITFTVRGVRVGAWTNYAMMTSNLFEGISVAMFGGEVTR